MKIPKHTIDEYRDISADVWIIYKKYFSDDANMIEYQDDVEKLTKKYDDNPRLYEFMKTLLKVYHDELFELKQLHRINLGG